MFFHDRRQRAELDNLVEECEQNGMSRREFMRRSVALGLSVSVAGALFTACGGASSSNTVDLISVWGGEEQASFKAVVAPFTKQNGITVNVESTRDLPTVLTTRLRGNNPPNIAILPNPGQMQQFAKQGKLVALDSFLDMNKVKSDYASSWVNLGSYNGKLYAIFYKAANKGTVWYNPTQFQSNNFTIPAAWQDLITLSNNIAGSGKYPWSMGVSAAAASGWPAADWVAQIYLNNSGPDLYDQWVAHKIPWTDASINSAFQMFGQIVTGSHFINGAPQAILSTDPQSSSYLPFDSPPKAYMCYLGDFAAGFISTQFPSLQAGTGYNFFPFPTINTQFAGAVTGGADVVVVMKNSDAVQKLVTYLETAAAQEIWIKRGGFTSVNKSVDPSAYPNTVAQNSAKQLAAAPIFRFGADDLMPAAVETAFWQATVKYIQNPGQLDSILSDVESTASQAYGS